jgi:hypothetical protein
VLLEWHSVSVAFCALDFVRATLNTVGFMMYLKTHIYVECLCVSFGLQIQFLDVFFCPVLGSVSSHSYKLSLICQIGNKMSLR